MNPISKPDFMPVDELRKMQLAKLQDLIPYEYEHDCNVILNPLHKDYKDVQVVSVHDFSFDVRLM